MISDLLPEERKKHPLKKADLEAFAGRLALKMQGENLSPERRADLEKAMEDINRAIKVAPTYSKAHEHRVQLEIRLGGGSEQLIKYLLRAIYDECWTFSYENLTNVFYGTGRFEEGAAAMKQLILLPIVIHGLIPTEKSTRYFDNPNKTQDIREILPELHEVLHVEAYATIGDAMIDVDIGGKWKCKEHWREICYSQGRQMVGGRISLNRPITDIGAGQAVSGLDFIEECGRGNYWAEKYYKAALQLFERKLPEERTLLDHIGAFRAERGLRLLRQLDQPYTDSNNKLISES